MADRTLSQIELPRCCGRRVEIDFAGGDISPLGGARLLSGLARRLEDPRQQGKLAHGFLPLLCQRVYPVTLGYEPTFPKWRTV